jgi:putative ABC transport system ATP-binding protein
VLTVRSLRKSFGGAAPRLLFDDLALDLAGGEFVAVMGESGSGKSTLLNLIAGLDAADAGSVRFDGTEILALSEDRRAQFRRTQLGFVFQAFLLLPYLDVAQNVALPLVLQGTEAAERQRHVDAALAQVGLRERASSRPHELSGGEAQRVAIARALVHRPRLVLADEPTGNLDAEHAGQVLGLLRDCVKERCSSCILVTHSPTAARTADRILVLAGGRLRPHSL